MLVVTRRVAGKSEGARSREGVCQLLGLAGLDAGDLRRALHVAERRFLGPDHELVLGLARVRDLERHGFASSHDEEVRGEEQLVVGVNVNQPRS